MFPRPVFYFTFHSFCCKLGRILGVTAALFFSLILCIPQAQGYGFRNGEAPPIQQAPPPQAEPNNPAQLFLPLVAGGASPLDHDEGPSQPPMNVVSAADHTGDSDTPPPEGNRYTFVADSDGHLDGYWFRNDLPDGQLKFTIEITSPAVSQSNLDPQGFLTQAAVGDFARRGVMPHEAELTLQVFDVDHDPYAETICPERDYIRVNGKQLTLPNESAPAFLRSGDDLWSEWKVYFPVTYLKFPISTFPFGGSPAPAVNEIAIDVNAGCQTNGWAVKIDWGSIALRPNLTNPIVFVPGWTGKMDTFQKFAQQATNDGYQAFNIPSNEYLNRGIATLEETAPQVLFLIERALTDTGAKKVFIVAHSRGGIFVRQALRMYQSLAPSVAGYLTISTVHHGTDLVKYIDGAICSQFSDELTFLRCSVAARTLMTAPMRAFNYGEACSHIKVVLRKLFDLSADYTSQLDSGDLSQALQDEFALHGIVDAQVERRQPSLEWAVASGTQRYAIHQACLLGECLLHVYLLTPVNEATDEISQPPLPYVDDYWINCKAQWKNGEATVPAYSVSSSELPCGDVGLETATFPWRADDVPFPHSANVDGDFCIDHL
jgi:pimeloyl-ACP methyl ester carboxylesterase